MTTSNNPDEIRADIERTRRELGQDVDALAEKVSPTKAVSRQTNRIKDGFIHAKENIMGSPEQHRHEPSLGGLLGLVHQRGGLLLEALRGALLNA